MKKLPILLTVVVIAALGYIAVDRFMAADKLEMQNAVLQNQINEPLVSSTTIVWSDPTLTVPGAYTLEHRCNGTIKSAAFPGTDAVVYCVGDNSLVLKDFDSESILKTISTTEDKDAPLLSSVFLVPGSEGVVLLSFGPNDCETANNCGVGYSPFTEYALTLSDGQLRELPNAPGANESLYKWNEDGTKALLSKSTEGGTGYSTTVIQGYDLAADKVTDLTTEKAAVGASATYQDVDGTILPHWSSLKWTSAAEFSAQLNNADGTKKDVTGSF